MKTLRIYSALLFFSTFIFQTLHAQDGTRIEPDKACINCDTPDNSAVIEIKSTNKGMLIPRMTTSQKSAISSPATGLIVFDETTKSFWYYNGTTWLELAGENPTDELQSLSDVLNTDNDAMGLNIANLFDPVDDQDAATKIYVDNHTDGDASSSNEIQNLVQVGSTVVLTGAPGSISINDADASITNEIQDISTDATAGNITLSDGSTLTLNVDDADADPINEIQMLSVTGTNLTLSNSGGTVSIADNDNDSSNEIQDISTNATAGNITLSSGSTLTLNVDDADADAMNEIQTLSLTGTNLTLSNTGGTVSIADNDNDSFNEIQDISTNTMAGNISLSDGSTLTLNVNDADASITNEIQDISTDATAGNISLSDGSTLTLNVDDADADATNEIQMISILGNKLTIDNGGNTIDLKEIADEDEDTRIRMEASLDEDIIRFDINGTERWVMDFTRLEPANTGNSIFIGEDAGIMDDLSNNKNIGIGYHALFDNTTTDKNVAIGYNALAGYKIGGNNIAIGTEVLDAPYVYPGTQLNLGIGSNVLTNLTDGQLNTSIGYSSMRDGTKGRYNVALGSLVMNKGVNLGDYNVGIGHNALAGLDGGTGQSNYNIGIGAFALVGNVSVVGYPMSGNANIGIGYLSINRNSTGDSNTALGFSTLEVNTTGEDNVALGADAMGGRIAGGGNYNHTGNRNIGIGRYALAENMTGNNNIAMGYLAMAYNDDGNDNIAIGYEALKSTKNGTAEIAIGYQAMGNSIGESHNIAIGKSSLGNATGPGQNNIGIGTNSMLYAEGATTNIAIGIGALQGQNSTNIMEGNQNVVMGISAMETTTFGSQNVSLGSYSMGNNTEGSYNTAIGQKSFDGNSTGEENVAVGYKAGDENDTGSYNVFLGADADASLGNFTNANALGYSAIVNATNKVRIGNSSITVVEGQVAYSFPSDGRFKNNVKEDVPGLDFINKLRPVTYNFDTDAFEDLILSDKQKDLRRNNSSKNTNVLHSGFIAQEVETAANEIDYDFHGVAKPSHTKDNYGLRYAEFVVPLVKSVQELSKENEEINDANELLREELEHVEENYNNVVSELADIKKMIAQLQGCCVEKEESQNSSLQIELGASENEEGAYLKQNAPNPFYEQTIIKYYLPKNIESATMRFSDWQGRNLKTIQLQKTGHGTISISAKELAAGTYAYTLVIDGKIIDTKKMILTKE